LIGGRGLEQFFVRLSALVSFYLAVSELLSMLPFVLIYLQPPNLYRDLPDQFSLLAV